MIKPAYKSERVTVYHGDRLEILPQLPKVDAVVTDPPYGMGIAANPVRQKHESKEWDDAPATQRHMNAMFEISKAQIIWGGNYFNPFAGSGTTAVACIREGKHCTLIEREQQYIDIICKRLEVEEAQGRLF